MSLFVRDNHQLNAEYAGAAELQLMFAGKRNKTQILETLQETNGDVDQAIELLLADEFIPTASADLMGGPPRPAAWKTDRSGRPPDLRMFPEGWFLHFSGDGNAMTRKEVVDAVVESFPDVDAVHAALFLDETWVLFDTDKSGSIDCQEFTKVGGLRDMIVANLGGPEPRRACQFGRRCTDKSAKHQEERAHPGDRDYRYGRVVFEVGHLPDLETLWELFQFFNTDGSGYLSESDFLMVVEAACRLANKMGNSLSMNGQDAWAAAGGKELGHVDMFKFFAWARAAMAELGKTNSIPLGLDQGSATNMVCHFQVGNERRCGCNAFKDAGGGFCVCGHKRSAHRSEGASLDRMNLHCPSDWIPDFVGLKSITNGNHIEQLQNMMTMTHKPKHNWTRDRGCRVHGVNACPPDHCFKNPSPVPVGYVLERAWKNQNPGLWSQYDLIRSKIAHECSDEVPYLPLESSKPPFNCLNGGLLASDCREYRLFHGTSYQNCLKICALGFRVDYAGTGMTWKKDGSKVGDPLYGRGFYCCDRITKADEYAQANLDGLFSILICRVIGGNANVVRTNAIDKEALKNSVFNGSHHSVFGDRVTELKKPFNEFVVYDSHQVYPEYLLLYRRSFP